MVRVEGGMAMMFGRAKIVKFGMDRHHDLPELRRPARFLGRARHKPGVVVDRLEQRRLEYIASVEHAISAVGEPTRPVCAHMRERSPQKNLPAERRSG